MRHILITIAGIICISAYGQEKLKKVKVKNEDFPSFNYSEVYYVLKNNREIKHGEYICIHKNGTTLKEGQFEKGLKEGLWIRYDLQKNILEKGEFNQNSKVGLWEYYGWKGEISMKYDHSANVVIYEDSTYRKFDPNGTYEALIDGTFQKVKLDSPPIMIGGPSRLYRGEIVPLRYPRMAQRMGIEGTAKVSVEITKDGEITNEKTLTNLGAGIEDEVLRLAQEIPNEWIPGYYKGKPVTVKMTIRTDFTFTN